MRLVIRYHISDEVTQYLCRMLNLLQLFLCHGNLQSLRDTLAVHYAGKADGRACQLAVALVQHMSDRKNRILILQDGLNDTERRHGDAVEGRALQGDDIRTCGTRLGRNLVLFTLLHTGTWVSPCSPRI